METIKSK